MKIKILCVGKIKEKFFNEALLEYKKRLSGYCKIEIIEVSDEKIKYENDSNKEIAMKKEGERLLAKIKDNDYLITLEIKGEKMSSENLANKINKLSIEGVSNIVFLIGGSYGINKEVRNRSNFSLSFSEMTFPHQLMRVVLLEQIYRTFKINKNEPYHK
ncbi:23S rRNA (pseudouridine(1915)-N(3))-methyltransferase RlmH [Gemelliphila asaccharolytica]|uniref:Ribosomal RNA large subunit methyltransferase H n=1 Tax=Gemelliphila asaccharolytica TaxID=502393 RepID=A0ABR5TNB4_9BACL|nr:23S rRNA (pseudouridine(1915)-N(3))-methyltransferase RlmH [Gemella asaccharolytica]KXB58905.1 rRNA large subunit m3Psi methyltransferase RlmH [Gemella asaccharolytica]